MRDTISDGGWWWVERRLVVVPPQLLRGILLLLFFLLIVFLIVFFFVLLFVLLFVDRMPRLARDGLRAGHLDIGLDNAILLVRIENQLAAIAAAGELEI